MTVQEAEQDHTRHQAVLAPAGVEACHKKITKTEETEREVARVKVRPEVAIATETRVVDTERNLDQGQEEG